MKQRTIIHTTYITTIIINSMIALGDIAIGAMFLYQHTIISMLNRYSAVHFIVTPVQQILTHGDGVGAFYFFSHGAVKLFLIWGLLRNKLWAYPTAMIFLTGFNVYQIGLLSHSFSWFIALLLFFNSVTVLAIAAEYKQLKK